MSDLGAEASANDVELQRTRSGPPRIDRQVDVSDKGDQTTEPSTIGAAIRIQAGLRPEEPAIVGNEFAPLSFGELQQQIDEVRTCLRQAGFDRDARIAVGIANGAEAAWAIVTVACSAAAVPLDPKLTVAEVEKCLLVLRPSAAIVLRDSGAAIRPVAEKLGIPIVEAAPVQPGKLGLRLSMPRIGSACSLDDPDTDAPAFILHTSGTTGESNLVPFSHRNVLASAKRVQTWFGLTPQDRCLNVSPVYYSHALTTTVLPPLLTGSSVAFPANPLNVELSEWLGTLRPTWYSAGPTLHLAVLEKAQLRPDARTMHSLRLASSAGARLPKNVQEGLQSVLGVPVLEHYGSSETAQISSNLPPPGPCKPGTCGIPWPGIIEIVGEDGRPVAAGEQGEILVRGPSVMSGYLNTPELNKLVFVDGWYRTGDIGSLDEQGFLSLHARKREIINRGGEKIAPLEVDHALIQHPAVIEAAAYAVPHARLGEDVAAAVVLRPGAKVTSDELRAFLGEHLATFKIPRRISFVDRLPKGVTGKVQRSRLNEIVARTSVPDASPDERRFQFWRTLKQLATFRRPDQAPRTQQNETTLDMPVLSEARLQAELLLIWKRILKVESLSIDDDFFGKGGNSLLAMDLHVEVQRLTTKPVPELILSEASTVRALAKALSA
ncbi:MAG: non-ribosomal peptide synthetase [Xanthobacteraceae bacterium]